jgi:MFS family permease
MAEMVPIIQDTRRAAPIVPLWPWGYAAVSLIALAAVLGAPLAAYVLMIAAFGLPHVLCELRYCDERFSARAPRGALIAIMVLLVALGGLRIAQALTSVPAHAAVWGELGLGVALAATAAWFMPRRRIVGAVAGCALAAGAALAPIVTFLVVAWLHNLTPLGFVAEILPARERRRGVVLLLIPFVLAPAFVASGLPQAALHDWLGYSATTAPSIFHAGRYPLSAFLAPTIPFSRALPLFSAAVFAQAMHYLSVIAVMPLLLKRAGGSAGSRLVPWPSWAVFYFGVGVLALFVFAGHAIDYRTARAFYGVAAAIHSWVELPIFLLALGTGFSPVRR